MTGRTGCKRSGRVKLFVIMGAIALGVGFSRTEAHAGTARQWGVFEKEIVATKEYSEVEKYLRVSVEGKFEGPNGRTYNVPGFWDGGNTWRIRFSPPLPGEWSYTISSSDVDLDSPENDGRLTVMAPSAVEIDGNPNFRGFLRVSPNRRYLTYADGAPFFWMGDTLWRGNTKQIRLSDTFKRYVDNRRKKKFNVIQIVVGDPRREEGGNEGGTLFIQAYDVINPVNFQWFDKRIRYITDKGMVPVIVGQWGKALREIPLSDLKRYWKYIIARYQAYNVIWVISGEYGFCDCLGKIRDLANYVDSLDELNHLTAIHPTPNPPVKSYSSAEEFIGERWIDFHMHQTWDQAKTRSVMIADYKTKPTTPFVNAEAGYDGLWGWDRDKVREDAWTVYMSGGAGYTYGAHGIWAWNNGCCDNYLPPHPRWQQVIDLESSFDMKRIIDFFSRTQWWKLLPMDDVGNTGYVLAQPGKEYLVYVPPAKGMISRWIAQIKMSLGLRTLRVNLSRASGTLNVEWFNPRTGEITGAGTVVGGSTRSFEIPFPGDGVLHMYEASS